MMHNPYVNPNCLGTYLTQLKCEIGRCGKVLARGSALRKKQTFAFSINYIKSKAYEWSTMDA